MTDVARRSTRSGDRSAKPESTRSGDRSAKPESTRSGDRRAELPPPGDVTKLALAAVFCGGVLGALARAGLAEAWPPDPGHWPWITFAVNIAGAALIGWLASRYSGRLRGVRYRLWGS